MLFEFRKDETSPDVHLTSNKSRENQKYFAREIDCRIIPLSSTRCMGYTSYSLRENAKNRLFSLVLSLYSGRDVPWFYKEEKKPPQIFFLLHFFLSLPYLINRLSQLNRRILNKYEYD